MIISRLSGGMGNQMFQYALGRVLAIKNNTELFLDLEPLTEESVFLKNRLFLHRGYILDKFAIVAKKAKRNQIPWNYRLYGESVVHKIIYKIIRKLNKGLGTEKCFEYNPKIMTIKTPIYLDGYWQSYKYFEEYELIIRSELQLKQELPDNILNLGSKISEKQSLCVHVRRGDYVGNKLHDVVDLNYYNKAINYIQNIITIDQIYVFSDDIDWCKKNLTFNYPTYFVTNDFEGEKSLGHFWLMQQCKNFIIPNSTFGWWAAWLAKNENKQVLVPQKWFNDPSINTKDLIPNRWIQI